MHVKETTINGLVPETFPGCLRQSQYRQRLGDHVTFPRSPGRVKQLMFLQVSLFIDRKLHVLSVKEKLLEDLCFSGWYLVNSIEHTV